MKITRWILTLAATLIAGSYLSSAWTADAVDFKKVAVEVNKNDAILLMYVRSQNYRKKAWPKALYGCRTRKFVLLQRAGRPS